MVWPDAPALVPFVRLRAVMFRSPFLLIFIFAAGCGRIAAASFTPESAAAQAIRQNTGLRAARLRVDEARGRLQQSGRLANPELEVDFTRKSRDAEGSLGLSVLQKFPVTQRLALERSVSRAQLAGAEAEVRDAARKLAAEVRAAAVRVLALSTQESLRREQLSTSRELSGFLRQRAEAGEVPRFEATQAEIEEQQLTLELAKLAAERAAALAALRPLLGLLPNAPLSIAGPLAPRRLARFGGERSDVTVARAQVEAATHATALARAARWEDIGVGFGVTHERTKDEPNPLEKNTVIGLRATLPLPLWNDQRGRIFEADAAARRAGLELDAVRGRAEGETAVAAAEAAGFERVAAQIDRELLPRARSAEEQVRAANTAGLAPFAEVIRARTRRLELEQRRLDAVRDWHLAVIRLEAAHGRSFLSGAPPASPARPRR